MKSAHNIINLTPPIEIDNSRTTVAQVAQSQQNIQDIAQQDNTQNVVRINPQLVIEDNTTNNNTHRSQIISQTVIEDNTDNRDNNETHHRTMINTVAVIQNQINDNSDNGGEELQPRVQPEIDANQDTIPLVPDIKIESNPRSLPRIAE